MRDLDELALVENDADAQGNGEENKFTRFHEQFKYKVLFKLSFHWCLADLFDTKAFLSST